jgi:hypothetical protein
VLPAEGVRFAPGGGLVGVVGRASALLPKIASLILLKMLMARPPRMTNQRRGDSIVPNAGVSGPDTRTSCDSLHLLGTESVSVAFALDLLSRRARRVSKRLHGTPSFVAKTGRAILPKRAAGE